MIQRYRVGLGPSTSQSVREDLKDALLRNLKRSSAVLLFASPLLFRRKSVFIEESARCRAAFEHSAAVDLAGPSKAFRKGCETREFCSPLDETTLA